MSYLNSFGFDTVLSNDWTAYPDDGLVCRIDNYKDFESLGYTSKHPRGAYALKQRNEGVITKLVDVIWNVGKSGAGMLNYGRVDCSHVTELGRHE